MITVLCGGVGAARFLRGLALVVPREEITAIGNTGDDIDIYGVRVSPDLDIVTYMLAGVFDEERGFGILGDTHALMDELAALHVPTWFSLGDRDLATCAARTAWLAAGDTLSDCTARIAERWGIGVRLLPMSDDRVETRVVLRDGTDLHFQEYWVRHRAAVDAAEVRLSGAPDARPAPGVLEAIVEADTVIVAPSNPVVSIGTIVQIPGIRDALVSTAAPVVGISPIIGGRVVRGMADRLLPLAGVEVSAPGVAGMYASFLDAFMVDDLDAGTLPAIRDLGIRAEAAPTMMDTADDAAALAKRALALARA